jgi:hypothetical protein
MGLLFDSFWRAAAYCLHPRVILLSLLPLVLMVAAALGLGWFFWDAALDSVRLTLEGWTLVRTLFDWLDAFSLGGLKAALAPLVVVFLATPVIVVVALLCVAALMMPSMVNMVAGRRFPALERKRGGSFLVGLLGGLLATLVALVVLLLSIPLWFIPPLVLIVPPLIWGWLSYRVFSYDVLAEHASREERVALIREHRPALIGMGVLTGYLGAAPSLVWASGVIFLALAPVLVPIAIWIYTLVFAFSALWFAHYGLAALQARRAAEAAAVPPAAPSDPALVIENNPPAAASVLPPPPP